MYLSLIAWHHDHGDDESAIDRQDEFLIEVDGGLVDELSVILFHLLASSVFALVLMLVVPFPPPATPSLKLFWLHKDQVDVCLQYTMEEEGA